MLATSLTNLKPNDLSEILSLSWMRQAIESLSEIHTNIKGLITDLEFPVSHWDEKWIDAYLDGSVKLLDICIALSSLLCRLDQSQLFLHFVIQMLEHSSNSSQQMKLVWASLHDWKGQFSSNNLKLENCHDILKNLAGIPYSENEKISDKSNVLMRALYGVKVHTVIVCSVITAALSSCSKPLIELRVPDKFLWSNAFNELQAIVLSEVRTHLPSEKVIMLKELEAVELCVERLHVLTGCVCDKDEKVSSEMNFVCMGNCIENEQSEKEAAGQEQLEKLEDVVSDLAGRSEKLSEGLDLLSTQIDGFFQIVLTGRDALLSNLRASNRIRESNEEENAIR
ncbi:hypothetical protein IEQ34_005301 [Dendrobium chrysotoxum]|uniref:Uncharacterized protein n=1 Tax=Dendrobium chrysotoxum TaxID=161865 RepID=A0AAV7HCM7_DENCH|nr:hypothetical protein IEQ34_005301 [Dendrobium chrysotoxum]